MTRERIELLRNRLNEMIANNIVDQQELQKLSEELDVLVLQAMKEKTDEGSAENMLMMEQIEELLNKLELFRKLYQSLRIVDPVTKQVLNLQEDGLQDGGSICHEFWQRKKVCENCISLKAYEQNDTIFKLEIKENSVYMIMAVPITVGEKRLVLEMIKNSTETAFLSLQAQSHTKEKLYQVMDFMNRFTL